MIFKMFNDNLLFSKLFVFYDSFMEYCKTSYLENVAIVFKRFWLVVP